MSEMIFSAFQIDPSVADGKSQVYDAIARIVVAHKDCEVVRVLLDPKGKLAIGCFASESDELMPRGKYMELFKWTAQDELWISEDDMREGDDDELYAKWKAEREKDETDDSFVAWLRNWYPLEYDERLRTYIYENLMDEDPFDEWAEEVAKRAALKEASEQ